MGTHDRGYKLLFSNKEMMRDLVEVERMIAEGTRNWADGWIKEGEKRGEERGREHTALRMLEHGMDAALIAKIAELPEERVRRLAAQSSPH